MEVVGQRGFTVYVYMCVYIYPGWELMGEDGNSRW